MNSFAFDLALQGLCMTIEPIKKDRDDLIASRHAVLRRNLALINIPPEDPGIPDWPPRACEYRVVTWGAER